MAGMAHGGLAQGSRLDGEVWLRAVGGNLLRGNAAGRLQRVGVRPGLPGRLGLGVLDRRNVNFQIGVDAQRRESAMLGGTDNAVRGTATVGW